MSALEESKDIGNQKKTHEYIEISLKALNILLIDDDKVDRQNIRRVFSEIDLDVSITECDNVEEALKAFALEQFDCVLIDYLMPGLDGFEGLEKLQKINASIPIVMITGQGNEILAVKAIQWGAQHYLPKERVSSEVLLNTINVAIENCRLKQKIDEQRSELENFGKVLAHDLKAPTRTIKSYMDLVQKAIDKQQYEKISDYYKHIKKSADHMDKLVDTLGEYSKIDGAYIEFHTLAMTTILECVLNNLSQILQEKNAKVTYDKCLQDIMIHCNEPQLVQLLQNLIANGIKYCESEVPAVHVEAEDIGSEWKIIVNDNGIGIPKEYYQHIFEPFKRLHGNEKYEGTGLGLATCKKIVERHKGAIWCESEEGKGTKFFFTLPK